MPRPWSFPLALTVVTLLGALPLFADTELPEVAAKVDGDPITAQEVIRLADTLVLGSGRERSSMSTDERHQMYYQVVNEIINDRLLVKAAKGTVVTDAEIDKRFQDLKRGYNSDTEFREALIKVGQTEASVRENIRVAAMEEKWIVSQVAGDDKADP